MEIRVHSLDKERTLCIEVMQLLIYQIYYLKVNEIGEKEREQMKKIDVLSL